MIKRGWCSVDHGSGSGGEPLSRRGGEVASPSTLRLGGLATCRDALHSAPGGLGLGQVGYPQGPDHVTVHNCIISHTAAGARRTDDSCLLTTYHRRWLCVSRAPSNLNFPVIDAVFKELIGRRLGAQRTEVAGRLHRPGVGERAERPATPAALTRVNTCEWCARLWPTLMWWASPPRSSRWDRRAARRARS